MYDDTPSRKRTVDVPSGQEASKNSGMIDYLTKKATRKTTVDGPRGQKISVMAVFLDQ
jgi:hypothetical protein